MANTDKVHYNLLYALIQSQSGTVINDHRREDLNKVLDQIFRDGESGDPVMLQGLLEKETTLHPIWQKIIRAITIGETYFFRNQAHFHALQNQMFPELIRQRRETNNKQLRIWSAGCASGEEPYSIAILLRELIPDFQDWSFTIIGTDINGTFLEQAQSGLYTTRSFRGETPEWVKARWFTENEGKYQLKKTIRDMVQFKSLNLLGNDYPSYTNSTMNMDVIFCRNVTIYFDLETTKGIVNRFFQALNTQGWLIVGHSEPQLGVYEQFAPINFEKAVFYQKPLPAPVVVLPPPQKVIVEPPKRKLSEPLRELKKQSRAKTNASPMRNEPRKFPSLVKESPARLPGKVAIPQKLPVTELDKLTIDELWGKAKQAADAEQWDDAMMLLARADEMDNLLPQVHYLRGLILMQIQQFDVSLMALRQAVYCDNSFALAHYTLGELYARQGAAKDAARHWKHAEKALQSFADDERLPYGDDELTAEMLRSLIAFRIGQL